MTLGEIQARQALSIVNKDRLGAVGKYQVIEKTLKAAIDALKLTADTKFDAATQERIFSEYLIKSKRPALESFITGKSSDIDAAQTDIALEFRSIAMPKTGKSADNVNKASISAAQIQSALLSAREQYQQNGGDYQQAVSQKSSASTEDREALNTKIEQLNNERVAIEEATQAKLKSLGIDAQANEVAQASTSLDIKKTTVKEQKQLDEQRIANERDAALDALAQKELAAQQQLDLANLTPDLINTANQTHLEQLRQFAADRLAIEEKFLQDKRAVVEQQTKVYGLDKVALTQLLADEDALRRKNALAIQGINNDLVKDQKNQFKEAFAPLENALDQSVNGILTGQQTIGNAAKHAAQSILLSYATTFIKKKAMLAAEWTWEAMGFAGLEAQKKAIQNANFIGKILLLAKDKAVTAAHWAWDAMGFGAKETTKTSIKAGSETAQTLAVAGGAATRQGIEASATAASQGMTLVSTLKKIGQSAAQAGAGAFAWVMSEVPFPLNAILAPVAAAAAFTGTLAFGGMASSKGGEWDVPKDRIQRVHYRETILPEWAANGWRKMVGFFNGVVNPEKTIELPAIAAINALRNSGALHQQLASPNWVVSLPQTSQKSADSLAHDRMRAEQRRTNPAAQKQKTAMGGITQIYANDNAVAKAGRSAARKFRKGGW